MSPVEKEHIVRAYTFELGKCYEQAIKERQLQLPGQHRPGAVRAGRHRAGPARTGADRRRSPTSTPSPALSQIGREWPADGRIVGIVVDPTADLDGVDAVRQAVFAAGMVPLLIAPHGGMVGDLPVQRTFATARSVEFDALLLAGAPAPAPGRAAGPGRQGRRRGRAAVDPRVLLLVEECWRHAKAIGAWGAGGRRAGAGRRGRHPGRGDGRVGERRRARRGAAAAGRRTGSGSGSRPRCPDRTRSADRPRSVIG